jgi:isoquinoline 1-oxidoreductase subunit beta
MNQVLVDQSRRSFLVGTGAFTVAIAFTGCAATDTKHGHPTTTFAPSLWVTVGSDGVVTLVSAVSEFGQGVMTSVPLILAEEMDLDWAQCKVVSAGATQKTSATRCLAEP